MSIGPTVPPQTAQVAGHRRHRLIMKLLTGFPIAVGCCVAGAAPVGADPNPFSTLSCSCRQTAPVGSADPREEIDRGIQEGLSAWIPGLPPPAQPRP